MKQVRAKKYLGQHFLNDETIAEKIVNSLSYNEQYGDILEIGPGMGVLTKYLLKNKNFETFVVEIDTASQDYLKLNFPELKNKIYGEDFLKMDLKSLFANKFAIIGNFPYNISSQILFKLLENKDKIPELVGMIQKEVAERICHKEGSRQYGILSVLLQTFFKVEYLFEVSPTVFNPPPKVWSAVIRLQRNERVKLPCDEKFFFKVVKLAFQTRRKTLRNSLQLLIETQELKSNAIFDLRAEQLGVEQFIELTCMLENSYSKS